MTELLPWEIPKIEPWERQERETRAAFAAFQAYLDLPAAERTLVNTARRLGKALATMWEWSARWHWLARAAAWDYHLARIARRAAEDEAAARVKQHRQLTQVVFSKLAQRIIGDEAAGIRPLDPNALSWADVRALLAEVIRLERQAHGIPDAPARAEISGPEGAPMRADVRVWQPDDEFLRRYVRVLQEAGLFDADTIEVEAERAEPRDRPPGEAAG